ncbi:hypothetical protein ACFQVD_08670 [Streptosporangium amethystogenes subsp. fukuiense]|uniref:Uncharacterized protein n=1 Tax=Streptosporangium amethystogenes subsp. fukuiense TaxID=698418 RepID=A0ABW2SV55_9ACTN
MITEKTAIHQPKLGVVQARIDSCPSGSGSSAPQGKPGIPSAHPAPSTP